MTHGAKRDKGCLRNLGTEVIVETGSSGRQVTSLVLTVSFCGGFLVKKIAVRAITRLSFPEFSLILRLMVREMFPCAV